MDFESIASIGNIEQRIAVLAAPTAGIVANWQLRRVGVSRRMVGRRLDDGYMRRISPQEFATGPAAALGTLDQRMRRGLAVVHAGPGIAALTRGTAAAQLDLLDRGDGTIHVLSNQHVRDLPDHGIRYHRSPTPSRSEIITVLGEPTTNPSRTIVDLGFDHTRYQIVRAMCSARDRDRLDRPRIEQVLTERRGRAGTAEVRAALSLLDHGCNGTRGRAEDFLVAGVLQSRILPVPDVCNRRSFGIAGIEPDLSWSGVGLVVFADGRPHSWEDVAEKDAQEVATLHAHGITVLRFANRLIWRRLPAVVAEIERAYMDCRRWVHARRPMSQAYPGMARW